MWAKTFSFDSRTNSWSLPELPALDSTRTLVMVFGASELQNKPSVFQALRQHYPNSLLVGCSTAGEILGNKLNTKTLSVAVMQFSSTEISTSTVVIRDRSQSSSALRSLAEKSLSRGAPPSAMLFLSDGVLFDQHAVGQAIREVIPASVKTFAAFAGDSNRFERTWVLAGDQIQSGMCVAVSFHGPSLTLHSNTTTDWGEQNPVERAVTKVAGNVIYELDNQPILNVCVANKRLLPLRLPDMGGRVANLSPVRIDREARTVVFHQEIAEGTKVRVLDANADSLISGAASVTDGLAGPSSSLALAISSIDRKLFLGKRANDEVSALAERLPQETPLIGFYSYGSIANDDHQTVESNAALSVVVFEEDASPVTQITNAEPIRAESTSPSIQSIGTPSSGGSVTLASVRTQTLGLGSVAAELYPLPTLKLIVMRGTLDERFKIDDILPQMNGRVLLDLGGIDKITSFGVREWLGLMNKAKSSVSELYLANCPEVVVNQMLMVRNFTGGGQIVSFAAPYICTVCSNSFEFILDAERTLIELNDGGPPDVACSECGNRAVFDDDPESYFEFLMRGEQRDMPSDIRNALAERRLDTMTEVSEAISKRVDDSRTTLVINRDLDEKIRWKRVLSGIEGSLRIDFSGSRNANDVGCNRLLDQLSNISDSVDEVLLDQAPLLLVEQFSEREPLPIVTFRSMTVMATCTNCGVARLAGISPSQIRDAARQGTPAEAECRRCSASIPLSIPGHINAFFSMGAIPKPAKRRNKNSGQGGAIPQWVWFAAAGLALVLLGMVAVALFR